MPLDVVGGSILSVVIEKYWLDDFKDSVYEAEDIMDEINYLRSKDIDAPRPDSNWVRDPVPFLNPANRRKKEKEAELQGILEKLKRLVKQKGYRLRKASSRPGRKRKTVAGSRNNDVTIAIDVDMNDRENGTGEVAEKLLDSGESSRPGENSGWTLLMTNLILEFASAVFDQLGYASIGMVLAFVALLLATAELIYMARKKITSLLPCFHRPSTGTSAPGEPVGTNVVYFGLVGAVWQCFYSTVEYAYARLEKDNPFKMCLLPFLFLLCVVFSKLIKK